MKNSLDPEWNETLEFTGTLRELLPGGLLLRVFDKDRFTSDDPIGDVKVSLDALRAEDGPFGYQEKLSLQGAIVFNCNELNI